jgi:hypothetical protein
MKWIFDQEPINWDELSNLYRIAPLGAKNPEEWHRPASSRVARRWSWICSLRLPMRLMCDSGSTRDRRQRSSFSNRITFGTLICSYCATAPAHSARTALIATTFPRRS